MAKKIQILFVEDSPADAVMINHELRRRGLLFRLTRVDTKERFLHELEHDPPDVILSDHGLPSFDGFTALAMARNLCPDVPFIFVTNSMGEELAIETFESGATDYVLKNKLYKLVPAVERALREAEERAPLKAQEQALRENEEHFRMFMEGVKDYAIFMLDTEGRVTSWNAGAQWIYGYRAAEVQGQHWSLFYPPAEVAEGKPARGLKAAAAEGRFEEEGLRSGRRGKQFWANVVVSALRDKKGKLRGFAVVTRNITERKEAEAALRQSEERFRRMVEEVKDYAIYMLDPEGRVTTWNAGAERIEGYQAAEILGKSFATFFTPEDVDCGVPAQTLKKAETEGQVANEGWRVRKDGSRFWSQGIVTTLRDESGRLQGFCKVAHDITRQKEGETEIRRFNEELDQRVRERTAQLETANQELEAFSYSVSHDLRSPLRHIIGYIEILQAEATRLDEGARSHLQTITESARQMNELIEALLLFSRMGRTEMRSEPISLNTLVEEARHQLQQDSEGRDIEWKIGPLPEAQGDPVMLRQAIVNLLANALKYTRTRAPARIEIGVMPAEGECVCFIRDNGVGFDPQYADKLFGVFQRLHPAGEFEGVGIGLANVRRIIHRHGGRTWADGAVDHGATFYFSIPTPTKGKT